MKNEQNKRFLLCSSLNFFGAAPSARGSSELDFIWQITARKHTITLYKIVITTLPAFAGYYSIFPQISWGEMAMVNEPPNAPFGASNELQPSNLRIVRVKRKRAAEAPEDLGTWSYLLYDLNVGHLRLRSVPNTIILFPFNTVIQDIIGDKKKKHNTALTDAFGGMGIGAAAGTSSQGGNDPEDAAAPAPRNKRYRRLATMTAVEMLSAGTEKLQKLLASGPEKQSLADIHKYIPAPSEALANTATQSVPAAKKPPTGRYEQIRRRKGLTNFEITESVRDPLRNLGGSVYDVVRMDVDDDSTTSQGPTVTNKEREILCNFLPMVREYIAEEETTKKQNGASSAHSNASDAAGGSLLTSGSTSSKMDIPHGSQTDADLSGYVYDLYVEADDVDNSLEVESLWDLHSRGFAPVVQILDDDTWLVVETSDVDDSDADSEDSNAEGYYGNDYPEEGVWNENSSYSSGSDFGGGKGHTGRRKEWFDESDTDSD